MAPRLSDNRVGSNRTMATIHSLSGRTNNSALLCRILGNWISTKENKKSPRGGTIIWVTNPVHIRETVQCHRSVGKKMDTKESSIIKIVK